MSISYNISIPNKIPIKYQKISTQFYSYNSFKKFQKYFYRISNSNKIFTSHKIAKKSYKI